MNNQYVAEYASWRTGVMPHKAKKVYRQAIVDDVDPEPLLLKYYQDNIKPIPKEFKGCPERECFLMLIHPNSDAGLACDEKCYFCKGESGNKYLENYIKKHPEKWELIKNKL